MRDGDPARWDATEQARAIRAGELTSVELLDAVLGAIERFDPVVNAVCTLDVERARAAAAEADLDAAAGRWRGPLHGLPITVKDAIETAGMRSTGGSVALREHVPAADAPAVAAAHAAGALVIGKTNVPLWSGDFQTFNEMFGTTRNPWDPARVPGGSSGGAAAAVACGMSSFEIGTDIGGSIRVPAAFCGVFGHKPTWGLVPTLGYLDAVGGGLTESDVNVFGPIARSARDLALLLGVLAAPSPERSVAWSVRLPEPSVEDVGSLRVATWLDEPAMPVAAEVRSAHLAAADALAAAGARVVEAHPSISFAEEWRANARLISEACSVSDPDDAAEWTRSHRQWLYADRARAVQRRVWDAFFDDHDVLLCPVTLVPAFEHAPEGEWTTRTIAVDGVVRPYPELMAWPAMIGSAYLPSTSVPVGRSAGGLPIGIQVVARAWRDLTAVRVAGWLAELTAPAGGGYHPPPRPDGVGSGGADVEAEGDGDGDLDGVEGDEAHGGGEALGGSELQ